MQAFIEPRIAEGHRPDTLIYPALLLKLLKLYDNIVSNKLSTTIISIITQIETVIVYASKQILQAFHKQAIVHVRTKTKNMGVSRQ